MILPPHHGSHTLEFWTFNWSSPCWTLTYEFLFLPSRTLQENTRLLSGHRTDTVFSSSWLTTDERGARSSLSHLSRIDPHQSRTLRWSTLHSSTTVPVVPPRHDGYPRFLSAAWPYYTGAISTSVGFLLFSLLWLAGGEEKHKTKKE
jgi:hypothetical protein